MMSNNVARPVTTSQPDYEREYYRQEELIKKLYNENEELRNTIIGMCKTLFTKREVLIKKGR